MATDGKDANETWDRFVEEYLLSSGVLNGVLMISHFGECVYEHGQLCGIDQNECQQLVRLFSTATPQLDAAICQKGLSITGSFIKCHYTIYKKTMCSIYATSKDDKHGLIVCNLPYGVLVAHFTQPRMSSEVIPMVERVCDLLRA